MEKDEKIRQRQANFRQTNAYAMQNGMILGLWAIGCQACFIGGLTQPLLANLWTLMFLAIPVLTWGLTLRFRKIVGSDINFPFSRGFMHAFLALLYAAVWAAVAMFVYMQFMDHGFIFDCYTASLSKPETIKILKDSGLWQQVIDQTGGHTVLEVVDELRTFGAANWAALIIYTYMLTSPIMAVIVGLFCMRRVHYRR